MLLLNVFVPPIVWFPLVLTTVLSTATVSSATLIPSPWPTLSVLFALNAPPPVSPLPAVIVLEVLTTVLSTATVSAATSIPVPAPTLSVLFADKSWFQYFD